MFKALRFNELDTFMSSLNKFEREEYSIAGKEIFASQKAFVKEALDTFYIEENVLDGQALMDSWFPKVNASVFISHSHKDVNEIYIFAGFLLKEFKIVSFIDSSVWGYANDLLKEVDNNHCLDKERAIYDYDLRNITTSNIFLMLSNALYNMLDHVECVMFVETPSSIKKISDEIKETKTESPWIFSELNMIHKLRIKQPKRPYELSKSLQEFVLNESISNENIQVEYNVKEQLESLDKLSFNDLIIMQQNKPANSSSIEFYMRCLDLLYDIKKGWYKNNGFYN